MEHLSIEKDFYFSFEDQVILKMAPLHYHDLYEIYYLTKGSCQCVVDNYAYQMQAGDVLLIPCESIHKVIYDSKPHSRLLVNFDKSYIPKSLQPMLSKVIYLARVPRIQKLLETIFQKIRGEYEHPDAFSKEYLGCYVSELSLLLARTQSHRSKVTADSNNFVERAVAYVHQNYMNKLTLVEVAKYCAVSAEHLSRNFKKRTGMGFSEYLTLHRLKCAQEMLFYYPELSISEIAYKCGFNDGNYFSVVYKRWCGVSPSKLNRLNGAENLPQNDE